MLEISLDKFRSFGEYQCAKIAPLTILVGENSAGKSTFLAALRYLLDFSLGKSNPSFNKEPFFLGGYRNIAHFRAGRYGRASHFKLGISQPISKETSRKVQYSLKLTDDLNKRRVMDKIDFSITFSDRDGDPSPAAYEISVGGIGVNMYLDGDNLRATIFDKESDFCFETEITDFSIDFFNSRTDLLSVEFFLRELSLSEIQDIDKVTPDGRYAREIISHIGSNFRRVSRRRGRRVFALAPVRTQPLRNYDPTQLSQSSEGDQLIGRIGRFARTDAKRWDVIRSRLNDYGSASGLFDSIDIQKLGTGETNPFQIIVRSSGGKSNIIDVGYSVSQVLPLFILLAESELYSTFLIQQPEVHLHPSAQAALGTVLAESVGGRRPTNVVVETHSDFLVDRVRHAVRSGDLAKDDVSILFFEKEQFNSKITEIKLDDFGEFESMPESYRHFFLNESMKMMGF